MFKKILLKRSIFYLGSLCLMAFNVLAKDTTVQIIEKPLRKEVLAVKNPHNFSSIQRCEEDQDSHKTCKDIYTHSSALCFTIDECEEAIKKEINELNEIYAYLQKCEVDEGCKKICREIYNNSRQFAVETCITLTWKQVRKLKFIYESLKNPTPKNLANINPTDFEIFVYIDPLPLETLIKELNIEDTKTVLIWGVGNATIVEIFFDIDYGHFMKTLIEELNFLNAKKILARIAKHGDIAEIFEENDDKYQLLPDLLVKVHEDVREALGTNISDKEDEEWSFIQKAIQAPNKPALNWIFNFFEKRCALSPKFEPEQEFCVFKNWYCKVNLTNEDAHWEVLLNYEGFKETADTTLSKYTTDPLPEWWNTNSRNLTAKQIKSLCGMDLLPQQEQIRDTGSHIGGIVTNITPITTINEGQLVYYAGLGKPQQVETLTRFWHGEGRTCNVQFGAELKVLGLLHEDNQSAWIEISDKKLHDEEGYLCRTPSRFFTSQELLSQTKPIFLSYDYQESYSVNQVDGFTKGDIVYYSAEPKMVQIKNALDLFNPAHDSSYTDMCLIEAKYQLKILGFSQDEKLVLLEIHDENEEGNNCNKGVQFSLLKEEISKI